jgi:hypothetical protein
MSYVLRRKEDGAYVAPSGRAKSYTKNEHDAKRFPTKEAAEQDACGNETAIEVKCGCRGH